MAINLYQVDAFTNKLFGGNPAAVCPLEKWLDDQTMQNIAMENNLSETAFFVENKGKFHIRWFTPNKEVDLCGHATLATAHVIYNHLHHQSDEIHFDSKSGILKVKKHADSLVLDFPADEIQETETPQTLIDVIGGEQPKITFKGVSDYMMVIESEAQLRALWPDFKLLKEVEARGLIITAPGDKVDFVSRCFYPAYGIDEDPVTGSAHTTLTPYWAMKLGKNELKARQLSDRGGELICRLKNDRVELVGNAVTYLTGQISTPV